MNIVARKNFRNTWWFVGILSITTYIIGGIAYWAYACSVLFKPFSYTVCAQEVGWDFFFWPIWLIFTMLTNTVFYVIFVTGVVTAGWYFLWHDKRKSVKQ